MWPWLAAVALISLGVGFGAGFWRASARTAPDPILKESLFYVPIGMYNSADAVKAAGYLLTWLRTKDNSELDQAIALYAQLIPREGFGGEYVSLDWLCRYFRASAEERKKMEDNPFGRRLLRAVTPNDNALLKEYLARQYFRATTNEGVVDPTKAFFLSELLRFNSPVRVEWEKTPKVMEVLALQPGQKIADVGCGPGYYTFQFSEAVGESGRVYAIETNMDHLAYVADVAKQEGKRNIDIIQAETTDLGVPGQGADVIFMCAVYQAIYGSMLPEERAQEMDSVRRSLEDDGRLVVLDNEPTVKDVVPYSGIMVSQHAVVPQVESFGFKLVGEYHFIPQRYMLVFKKT